MGTLVVSGGALANSLPASAADALNAVTYDGTALFSAPMPLRSSFAYGTGDQVTVLSSAGESLQFNASSAASAGHSIKITVAPPSGGWTTGEIAVGASASARWDVVQDGEACVATGGRIQVSEVARDAMGAVSAFAASYAVNGCGATGETVKGDLRYNSSTALVATAVNPSGVLDFGSSSVGDAPSATKTITLTAVGNVPTEIGLLGPSDPSFMITGDACSFTTVAPGHSCTLTVVATPKEAGANNGYIVIADNSVAGHNFIYLTAYGIDNRTVDMTPSALVFNAPVGTTTAPQTITVTVTGSEPVTFSNGSQVTAPDGLFSVVADTCSNKTIAAPATCTVSVTAKPAVVGTQSGTLTIFANTIAVSHIISLTATGTATAAGEYAAVAPTRLLDTRTGLGASKAPVGPKGVVRLQVTGRGGVPATASAVVLNVTVTGPTADGFVSAYPDGAARPSVSSLNFPKGWTGANSVTVAVGKDGKVDLYNNSGSIQLIADVVGYYLGSTTTATTAGDYQPVVPMRLLDSRGPDSGGRLGAGGSFIVPADFGMENAHVRAWAVNITAVTPAKSGFFTTWSGSGTRPTASTLNYEAGQTASNFAIVPSAPCVACAGADKGLPSIGVYTSAAAYVIVDIFGYYDDGVAGDGLRFQPMSPVRIVDSRSKLGLGGAVGTQKTAQIGMGTPLSSAYPAAVGLALNVTSINPTKATYLTVWPVDPAAGRPAVSNVNAAANTIVPNAAVVVLGDGDKFNLYNNNGTVNVCVDVAGVFYFSPTATASAAGLQAVIAARTGDRGVPQPRRLVPRQPVVEMQ